MRGQGQDSLLVRALDLNTAALSVAEATTQLIEFLRGGLGGSRRGSRHDYATSCRYFTRAHQQYLTNVAAFLADLEQTGTAGERPGCESVGSPGGARTLAEARAISGRIQATLRGCGSGDGKAAHMLSSQASGRR